MTGIASEQRAEPTQRGGVAPGAVAVTNGDERRDPNHITWIWKLGWLLCRPIMAAMFQLKVYGRNPVPRPGGVLLVSNHQSYLDPILVGLYLPRPMSYLAKSELFKNKFLSW